MREIGTSKAMDGPDSASWRRARRLLQRWEPAAEETALDDHGRRAAGEYQRALAETLERDQDAFGLRQAMITAGERLIATLEILQSEGFAPWASPEGSPEERAAAFTLWFRDSVAGEGGTLTDAAIRRAVTREALHRLLGTPEVTEALTTRRPGVFLTDDLFCLVYTWFFADIVAEFVKTAIAEKIKIAFPVLSFVDPAGIIANWLAEQIYAELPKPCEIKDSRGEESPSLGTLARELLQETVTCALGLPSSAGAAA